MSTLFTPPAAIVPIISGGCDGRPGLSLGGLLLFVLEFFHLFVLYGLGTQLGDSGGLVRPDVQLVIRAHVFVQLFYPVLV